MALLRSLSDESVRPTRKITAPAACPAPVGGLSKQQVPRLGVIFRNEGSRFDRDDNVSGVVVVFGESLIPG
jgi:hypothetical protein